MRRRLLAVLGGLMVAAGAVLVGPTPAMAVDPAPSDGVYQLSNGDVSSHCLFMKSDNTSAVWTCNTTYGDQLWQITGGSHGTIQNIHSGLCLRSNSTASGAALTAATCDTSSHNHWSWYGGSYGLQIVNDYSHLCLLVKNGATGVTATQYTCEDYSDQEWNYILY